MLDLTRMITLTALPSTFAVFVGSTLLFLWVGVAPRLAITLGVVIDGALIAALLLWLVQRTLCQEVPDLRPGRCIAGLESIKEKVD
ncbi:MAG: hypothetical protein M0Z85_03005 [Gammaproteobacteria bacterium]|nr:hypothetical protein [Gammaproteobacteria bacterium]